MNLTRRFAVLSALTVFMAIAACGTAQSNKDPAAPSASSSPAAPAPSSESPAPEKAKGVPVKALHISFELPAGWTVESGEESFAFQNGGAPAGGLDGLGYNDTIEGLLPNGATVDSQTELTGLPVKAIKAKLTLDGQGDQGKRQEVHYFFFLPDQKAVYDLHFDAKQVKEADADAIAQTAAVK